MIFGSSDGFLSDLPVLRCESARNLGAARRSWRGISGALESDCRSGLGRGFHRFILLAGIFTRFKCFEKNGTSVSFELNRNVTYYWKLIRQSGPGSACHESSNPEPALFLPDLW